MKDEKEHLNLTFRKDFLWYFIGSLVPLAIGFIKTPVFTRHFDKESFGQLGLVTITFSFLGMLLFSWIGSCLWRFYNKYNDSGRPIVLFSNLFFLFLSALFVLALFTAIWFWNSRNDQIQELVFYSFLQLVFNQYLVGYLVVIRLRGGAAFYNVFQGFRSLLGLLVSLYLVFYLNLEIVALVIGLVAVDTIFVTFLTISNPANIKVNFQMIEKRTCVELLQYGSAGLLLNMSLISISYSDRFVIAMFHNLEEVGIYDQVSKIAQLSVLALITVYFNTINPTLLKILDIDYENSLSSLQKYMLNFIFFGVPIVFYFSLFSEEIGIVLLGAEFREGSFLMPFIFAATFIHGFSNFFELRLKFSNRLIRMGVVAILAALLNVGLNIIFIPNAGYQWAAYSTLITYLFMIFILSLSDKEVLTVLWLKKLFIFKILIVLTIQYIVYRILDENINLQPEIKIGLGIVFGSMYFLVFRKYVQRLEFH